MVDQIRVSVVMPAYNHERFVGEAVESVLNQSLEELELIVIDDGSSDQTADIVKAYDDSRVHYFYQDNQDAYNALNNGMAKARGEYVSIINSDDVYLPDRLERLLKVAHSEGADCVISNVAPIDDDSQPLDDPDFGWNQWHQNNRQFYLEQADDLYRGFLHGNLMVTTSNLLMTRAAMETVGGFAPIRYLHDYDYIFRLLLACPDGVHYAHDQILMNYRIHDGNTLSEAAILGREQDQEVIRQYMLAKCPVEIQSQVNAGVDRLIALDQELLAVREQLANQQHEEIVPVDQISSSVLAQTLLKRLRSKLPF